MNPDSVAVGNRMEQGLSGCLLCHKHFNAGYPFMLHCTTVHAAEGVSKNDRLQVVRAECSTFQEAMQIVETLGFESDCLLRATGGMGSGGRVGFECQLRASPRDAAKAAARAAGDALPPDAARLTRERTVLNKTIGQGVASGKITRQTEISCPCCAVISEEAGGADAGADADAGAGAGADAGAGAGAGRFRVSAVLFHDHELLPHMLRTLRDVHIPADVCAALVAVHGNQDLVYDEVLQRRRRRPARPPRPLPMATPLAAWPSRLRAVEALRAAQAPATSWSSTTRTTPALAPSSSPARGSRPPRAGTTARGRRGRAGARRSGSACENRSYPALLLHDETPTTHTLRRDRSTRRDRPSPTVQKLHP